MMLTVPAEKVKRKIKSIVNKVSDELTKPKRKFLLEMLTGMLSTGKSNLTSIARSLKEDTDIKHTSKRIHRHISTSEDISAIANNHTLHSCKSSISTDTLICLDGGDLSYSQARGYEFMDKVHDGSRGLIGRGYPLNMVVCRNGKDAPIPVLLEVFHRQAGYISDNTETLGIIERFTEVHGGNGIWTLDRGYDNKLIMGHILRLGGNFNIRQTGRRHLTADGHTQRASDIAPGINRRYKYRKGAFGYKRCYLGNHPVTLIYYKYVNVDLLLLSSGHITKKSIVTERIDGYLRRWGVEESYKFIKQSFGLERCMIRKFAGIKCLLGIILLAWKVVEDVSEDDELRAVVEKAGKAAKKKVTFYFYRIINGIQSIFNQCKEMYRFRKRRKRNEPLTIEHFLAKYHDFTLC
jgi:hypothetical protein